MYLDSKISYLTICQPTFMYLDGKISKMDKKYYFKPLEDIYIFSKIQFIKPIFIF